MTSFFTPTVNASIYSYIECLNAFMTIVYTHYTCMNMVSGFLRFLVGPTLANDVRVQLVLLETLVVP